VNLNTLQNPFEPLNALGEGRKFQGHGTIENHITDTQTEALKPPESLGGLFLSRPLQKAGEGAHDHPPHP
jgi:hypothetical protein